MLRLVYCIYYSIWSSIHITSVYSDIVRFGAIFPITDQSAEIDERGAQWLAGSLIAVDDLNKEFKSKDIEFKLAVRDSKRTFSNTVRATLELAEEVYNGNGSQIIIGAGFNPATEAMAYVTSDSQNDLAQVAYSSNISSLRYYICIYICIYIALYI
jgi:hypothetical protein